MRKRVHANKPAPPEEFKKESVETVKARKMVKVPKKASIEETP
jgi:hypothetical protein